MNETYLLSCDAAKRLYNGVKDLPVIDYHCHLSPKEIFDDKPFDNIGEMWLGGDHYKWRLMRIAGIDEKYITGDAPYEEKFAKYAEAIEFAAGNPLYHWSHMELSMFFGIIKPLTAESASEIYAEANAYIRAHNLSPRALIKQSRVEAICTTDDVIDDLSYHQKIREDASFNVRVLPSFRTDNLLLIRREGYGDYIKKLSAAAGINVTDFKSFKAAVKNRVEFFAANGCRMSDVGIPFFPSCISDDAAADATFGKALSGEAMSDGEYSGFLGNMYLFLAELYRVYGMVMQWHLAVSRNANSALFGLLGADCGVDCVGEPINGNDLVKMLDAINKNGMPETVIYTLNPSNAEQLASIAGAFRRVRCGAAWWFCDHKRGIREQLEIVAENSPFGKFLGMLTDSRSFLSYARHDYFRRILCSLVGEWVDGGEYGEQSAARLVEKISYKNIKELMGECL